MFFDLERDPLERVNLFHNPEYQTEIAEYRERLLEWALFSGRSPNHLDLNAPCCSSYDRPEEDGATYRYVKNNMDEYFAQSKENTIS